MKTPDKRSEADVQFEQLFTLWHPRLIRNLTGFGGQLTCEDAEEIADDVLAKLHALNTKVVSIDHPDGWIRLEAQRRAVDRWRKRNAQRRGGSAVIVSLETEDSEVYLISRTASRVDKRCELRDLLEQADQPPNPKLGPAERVALGAYRLTFPTGVRGAKEIQAAWANATPEDFQRHDLNVAQIAALSDAAIRNGLSRLNCLLQEQWTHPDFLPHTTANKIAS